MSPSEATGNVAPNSPRESGSRGYHVVKTMVLALMSIGLVCASARAAPDYSKRAEKLAPGVIGRLIGKWTNPVDNLVIEIRSVDPVSGELRGRVSPTSGPAAADEHELVGWVSGAPRKESYDSVVPVTFSTSLYEYGTLPVWAGFLRDDKLVTMHYLVWPNRPYSWDHISAFSETWVRVP